MQFYTDDWGVYERQIEPALHTVGKRNTQKIDQKHLTLRTRIKPAGSIASGILGGVRGFDLALLSRGKLR